MRIRGSGIGRWLQLPGNAALARLTTHLLCALLLGGCVSKKKAEERARTAFFAGQKQAAMFNRQTQLQGPTVTVLGEVRNALVRWTLDLTLAKALVSAEYYGKTDPGQIVIQRDGQEIVCDPKKLLSGDDVPLQPNDVIQVGP